MRADGGITSWSQRKQLYQSSLRSFQNLLQTTTNASLKTDIQHRLDDINKKLKDRGFAAAVSRDDIRQGAEELADAYRRHGMDEATFHSSRFLRVKRVLELQADGRLDAALRWRTAASNA